MWIDESGEFAVRLVDLPGDIHAAVKITRDGTDFANIYINDKLAPAARLRAFNHERRHVRRDDFRNDMTIEEVEDDNQ
jgi:hypothetical protein